MPENGKVTDFSRRTRSIRRSTSSECPRAFCPGGRTLRIRYSPAGPSRWRNRRISRAPRWRVSREIAKYGRWFGVRTALESLMARANSRSLQPLETNEVDRTGPSSPLLATSLNEKSSGPDWLEVPASARFVSMPRPASVPGAPRAVRGARTANQRCACRGGISRTGIYDERVSQTSGYEQVLRSALSPANLTHAPATASTNPTDRTAKRACVHRGRVRKAGEILYACVVGPEASYADRDESEPIGLTWTVAVGL